MCLFINITIAASYRLITNKLLGYLPNRFMGYKAENSTHAHTYNGSHSLAIAIRRLRLFRCSVLVVWLLFWLVLVLCVLLAQRFANLAIRRQQIQQLLSYTISALFNQIQRRCQRIQVVRNTCDLCQSETWNATKCVINREPRSGNSSIIICSTVYTYRRCLLRCQPQHLGSHRDCRWLAFRRFWWLAAGSRGKSAPIGLSIAARQIGHLLPSYVDGVDYFRFTWHVNNK